MPVAMMNPSTMTGAGSFILTGIHGKGGGDDGLACLEWQRSSPATAGSCARSYHGAGDTLGTRPHPPSDGAAAGTTIIHQ